MRIILYLIFAALIGIVGCSNSGRPVHFILPDGFEGEITLIPDQNSPTIPFINDHYQIRVPKSGTLKVHDIVCLQHWHTEVARWESGGSIPQHFEVPENIVSWIAGETDSNGVTKYFLGTYENYKKFKGWTK
jgi:hypothetical protein